MSSLLSAELSATCNALGAFDKRTGKYYIDQFTLNTVKDLIRYLRRDGEDHEIRRHFGETKVLQTDLIPMLIDHWENNELFDVTLRLLVNLTNPALLLYREEVPTDRSSYHNYLQILSHLQSYKEEAFTKVETWNIFSKKIVKVLEIEWDMRDEDTGLVIERILILIRNILHVPADLDQEKRLENDASVHDKVLWALNQAGILDVILYMSSENEKQYFMHILEIISHLLREQNPTCLADSALQRSIDEKLKDEQELLSIRMTEIQQRNSKVRQYSASRHSRFGGTYVLQNMKSISDNEMICLKPLNKISNLDFGGSKREKFVKPKNRRPVESDTMERRSAFAIRLFLKEFCIEFLNGCYNTLMHHVKDVLVRAVAQQNDESYYLWAIKFFMEFNRGYNFQVGLVSETMSVPMFHFVQQQMEKYFDMIKVEKKKFALWVKRLHLALRAYKELLNTLLVMDKCSDSSVRDSAKVLKSNIFYVVEYREFILNTMLSYDDNKMPRCYLVDLIETLHLFLKMLEHYCKNTGLVVQKKIRKKSKKKKIKASSARSIDQPQPPAWEEVRAQLAVVLTNGVDNYPPPFDAASDTPVDQQRGDCMKNIQRLMRDYKFEDAIGMFRAAREVWPEEGIFGTIGIPEDVELDMLESVYSADLEVEMKETLINDDQENQENEDEYEDEEEEERSTTIVESDFQFQDFVQRFCHPRVVSGCVYLLERYDSNLPHTNHCIIKMLHRIAWDCNRPSMMFQATLLLIFQRLLHNSCPMFKELQKFAIFIIRKFTETAANNPKTFIELLFWKTTKDCLEIDHGYEVYNENKLGKATWTEEQEEELRNLYMENQQNPVTDKDVIDWILENLIDQTRTRRGVIKELKELGLIFRAPTKKSNARIRVPVEFSEEEDEILKQLWIQYSETNDPMGAIISRMPQKRSKRRFVERLLQLNIIQDKRECRKKRTKKSGDPGDNQSNSDSSERSDNSDDDDNDHRLSASPSRMNNPTVKKHRPAKPSNKKQNNTKKKTDKSVTLTASETAKVLIEAVDNNLSNALKWLMENLEEVALDQEAEGYDPEGEAIPLVPISTESVDAMENELFHKVLKGVGLKPPSNEQEMYWRIPSSLHFETLRKRREIILKALEKDLLIETEASIPDESTTQIENEKTDSSDDDDLFNNLRRMRETAVTQNVATQNNKQTKRRRNVESSPESNRNGKIPKFSKDVVEGDSDDDILNFAKKTLQCKDLPDTEDILSNIPQNLSNSDDSEEENQRKVINQISDEDSPPRSTMMKRKRCAVIEDDSD